MSVIIHTCSCGRKYTQAEWEALPYLGLIVDPEETLELRNCTCGSTRAIVVAPIGHRQRRNNENPDT